MDPEKLEELVHEQKNEYQNQSLALSNLIQHGENKLHLNLKHTANRALMTLHCSNRFDSISYGELQTSCSSHLFFFL